MRTRSSGNTPEKPARPDLEGESTPILPSPARAGQEAVTPSLEGQGSVPATPLTARRKQLAFEVSSAMSGKPSDADKRGAAAGIALQGGSTATPAVLPPSPARSSKYVEPFASTVLDAARIADPANHGRYSAELARASVYSVRASADGGGGGGTGSALADAAAAAPPSASAAPPPPPPGPVTKALLRLFKGTRLGRELKELGFRGWLRSQLVTIILVATCVAGLLALQQTGWRDLPVDAWWTVWSVFIAMVLMVRGDADPDICLFLTNTILLLRGVVQPNDVFSGFANVSIVTIALMMAVATGLESAGVLDYVPTLVLGSSRYIWLAQVISAGGRAGERKGGRLLWACAIWRRLRRLQPWSGWGRVFWVRSGSGRVWTTPQATGPCARCVCL